MQRESRRWKQWACEGLLAGSRLQAAGCSAATVGYSWQKVWSCKGCTLLLVQTKVALAGNGHSTSLGPSLTGGCERSRCEVQKAAFG